MSVQRIEIEHECGVCGNDRATLITEAKQAPVYPDEATDEELDAAWWAHDGDEVVCVECGAVHVVSMDNEHAYVSLNEDHPATIAAQDGRDARSQL